MKRGSTERMNHDSNDAPRISKKHKKLLGDGLSVHDEHHLAPILFDAILPSPLHVSRLREEAQAKFVKRLGMFCEKAIYCIDAGVGALIANRHHATPSAKVSSVEDAILADMVRLREVPVAREFVDMTLWRRLRKANESAIAAVADSCFGSSGEAAESAKVTSMQRPTSNKTAHAPRSFASYKQLHMRNITERYADDLELLRSSEVMDGERVQFLLQCLDAGAELASSLSMKSDTLERPTASDI
jgi:hypothetical protein